MHEVIPVARPEERLGRYRVAIQRQNAVWITAIHQMDGTFENADLLGEFEAAGALNLRVALHYWMDPSIDDAAIDALISGSRRSGRRWGADEVVETDTAWLDEPDSEGGGNDPWWPDMDQFRRTMRRVHDAGLRIAAHAIGERAVRELVDTYITNAARAIGEAEIAGILRPGFRADFVAWGPGSVRCRAVEVTELQVPR